MANASSPYLKQHADHPVAWVEWSEKAFAQAKAEHKLVIVSIGYSACHWCHVMAHESFEDEETAGLMNRYFVNIKVDREERPDVDQLYMTAVQLMTQQGGWPLNCILLPDGRPIYGGTYFPKNQWQQVLEEIQSHWEQSPDKVLAYATQLTAGIRKTSLFAFTPNTKMPSLNQYAAGIQQWQKRFDLTYGGSTYVPKFPLPNGLLFLFQLGNYIKDPSILHHVTHTLVQMGRGGLFDQIGGGFARYSTDAKWMVPHFEKMLYDNAQLLSLYAIVNHTLQSPFLAEIIKKTLSFVEREMTSPTGGFYAALDADSEGIEGKYYVWTLAQLKDALGELFSQAEVLYHLDDTGLWEHNNYILMRTLGSVEPYIPSQAIDQRLLQVREGRIAPGLDDKIITAWNGLMVKGLVDVYLHGGDQQALNMAISAGQLLCRERVTPDGGLLRIKNPVLEVHGFLEDYCFAIQGLIDLFEATGTPTWMVQASSWMEKAITYFKDTETPYFFSTGKANEALMAKSIEMRDNVLPSPNGTMAQLLFKLGHFEGNFDYIRQAQSMLLGACQLLQQDIEYHVSWARLVILFERPFITVTILGPEAAAFKQSLMPFRSESLWVLSSAQAIALGSFKNKYVEGKTLIYICENQICYPPFENATDAIAFLHAHLQ